MSNVFKDFKVFKVLKAIPIDLTPTMPSRFNSDCVANYELCIKHYALSIMNSCQGFPRRLMSVEGGKTQIAFSFGPEA